jgi:hypothetical protein
MPDERETLSAGKLASPALIFVCLSLLAGSVLGILIAGHKAGGFRGGLSSHPYVVFPALLALAALAKVFVSAKGERRRLWLHSAVSALILAATFIAAEFTLRALAVSSELGKRIGDIELLPHDWDQVRLTNTRLLRNLDQGLYIADPLLGWDTGKNRESGLYATSAEGIRSAKMHYAYADTSPRQRVALLGDSFTFGEEVPFEETWGVQLEKLIDAQVLNFAVTSHGLDQTLLKFEHKVAPWNAQVVILGMLNAAGPRSGQVYLSLRPDQAMPFMKPRFVIRDGEITTLNVPVIPAAKIYSSDSIFDLPLLQSDAYFLRGDWEPSGFDASHLMRYLFSRFPRWDPRPVDLSDASLDELSARLIESLARKVERSESSLVIVFLPERAQFEGKAAKHKDAIAAALAKSGQTIYDPTACLLEKVNARDLFVESGAHYSAKGNAALAACLAPRLEPLLAKQAP